MDADTAAGKPKIDLNWGWIVLFALGYVYAYAPTLASLHDRWIRWTEPYSHGYLVLATTLFLCFRQRHHLRFGPGRFYFYIPLLGGCFLAALTIDIDINVGHQLLLPINLMLAVGTLYGWAAFRRFAFPIGLLFFAIPVWDVFTPVLQQVTVVVNRALLELFNIPAQVDGNFVTISIPGSEPGIFEIARGCAGLIYFIVGLTCAVLYGLLYYRHVRNRLILIAIGVLLSVVSNWIRVFIIILVGYFTNMESSLVHEHHNFGWFVFAVTLIPMFVIAGRLERNEQPNTASAAPAAVGRSCITSLILAGAGLLLPVAFANSAAPDQFAPIRGDLVTPAWQQSFRPELPPAPKLDGVTQSLLATYANAAEPAVNLQLYLYSHQSQGKELIGDKNRLVAEPWRLLRQRPTGRLALAPYGTLKVAREDAMPVAVLYWYQVGGVSTQNEVAAKLLQAFGKLTGREDGALVYASAPCTTSECDAAYQQLQAFRQDNAERIDAALYAAYKSSVNPEQTEVGR